MRIRHRIYTIIMAAPAAALLLGACQPTPDEAAVIYGGDLEEKIARPSASVAFYDAPQNWQETLDIGHGIELTLVLNAVDGGVINLDPYYQEDMNKTY